MNIPMWFQEAAARWNIELSREQLMQFETYYHLLLERNKQVNLTRITEEREVYGKHFLDSLSLVVLKQIKDTDRLMDVGTGAGFPSIPLKIVFPYLQVTLLDSLKKRVMFLEEVVSELQLEGVTLVHGRAEEVAHDLLYRERFDIVTARAVAGLNVLAEYCVPFVKVGGVFISMKGTQVGEEMNNAAGAIRELGAEHRTTEALHLPGEMGERHLVVIKKKRKSPKIYPRKAGTPAKKPL